MKLPTLFISHGGGPWPWLHDFEKENSYSKLHSYLKEFPHKLEGGKPKLIIIFSAHWEESQITLMSHAHPPMLYDYTGFPKHTNTVLYPAPGAPGIVPKIKEMLEKANIQCRESPSRGFDHGVFVPLTVMFPKADVPVLQISLKQDYDPVKHLKLGQALAPLRDAGILIIGSGHSYHNLNFAEPKAVQHSQAFEAWLEQALCQASPAERIKGLVDWTHAPSARKAHPKEDHLMPLLVAAGAAPMAKGKRAFFENFPVLEGAPNWDVSCFEFWDEK